MVSEIQLYELLKAKLGEKEASAFVEILEKRVDREFEENRSILATKEDLAKLEGRIGSKIYLVGLVQYLAIIASLINALIVVLLTSAMFLKHCGCYFDNIPGTYRKIGFQG